MFVSERVIFVSFAKVAAAGRTMLDTAFSGASWFDFARRNVVFGMQLQL